MKRTMTVILLLLTVLPLAGAQTPAPRGGQAPTATPRWTPQEAEALRIVNAWDEAWRTKDPEKIAAYMSDDVAYEVQGMQKGREQFVRDYRRLMMEGIDYYEILSEYAAGGERQTVVVQKRIDHITRPNGDKAALDFVGYFRVQGGKIVEWRDIGIRAMPAGFAPLAPRPPGQ